MVRRCAHRIWELTGPRRTVQDTAAAERTDYCFRAGSWDYINIRPPHRFLYRSVRLQNFLTCMGNRTDFCIDLFAFTTRSPASETAPFSVRVITTSVSLTAERPFRLQGTHVIPILFWSQFTIDIHLHDPHRLFFFRPKLKRNRIWETSIAFLLYLPPSIGLLLTVRSRFFCTRYRV